MMGWSGWSYRRWLDGAQANKHCDAKMIMAQHIRIIIFRRQHSTGLYQVVVQLNVLSRTAN